MALQATELRMHHALIVGIRLAAGVVGAVAYYLALFMYEGAAGVLQNRIDNLWSAIYERSTITNSTSIAAVGVVTPDPASV